MNDPDEKHIPSMSDLEFEDVVSVLMGVQPEGEEIVIYEESDIDSAD